MSIFESYEHYFGDPTAARERTENKQLLLNALTSLGTYNINKAKLKQEDELLQYNKALLEAQTQREKAMAGKYEREGQEDPMEVAQKAIKGLFMARSMGKEKEYINMLKNDPRVAPLFQTDDGSLDVDKIEFSESENLGVIPKKDKEGNVIGNYVISPYGDIDLIRSTTAYEATPVQIHKYIRTLTPEQKKEFYDTFGSNIMLGRNPDTGNVVYTKTKGEPTPGEIPGTAGLLPKQPSEADVKFQRDYTKADAIIDELETLYQKAEDSLPEGMWDRIVKYPKREFERISQKNPNLVAVNAARNAASPGLIRALGEVGTLTDKDREIAMTSVPTTNDTKAVREVKLNNLRSLITEIYNRGKRGNIPLGNMQQSEQSNTGKVKETKILNGVTYIKINGEWYKQ